MRVCVTGGSGFIGWYACHRLATDGHEITILDLIEPGGDLPVHAYVKGDVRDPKALDAAFQGCDAVMHLAAAHHDFGIEDDTYFDVNERAALLISDAMDAHGIRQCIFYSTVAVYGDAPEPHFEHSPTKPNSPYGASKLAGEGVFQGWTERGDGRRCLVIRPTVTFGPHNFANMYSLIRQIDSGKFVRVGPGTNIKSLSYVENIVDCTMFLWNRGSSGEGDTGEAFGVYNFIDKPDLTSRQISESVYRALGKTPPSWSIPMWAARLLALPFDIVIALTGKNIPISGARVKKLFAAQTKFEADKIRDAGYVPGIPLDEAIGRMVAWYLKTGKNESAEWHQPPKEPVLMEDRAKAIHGDGSGAPAVATRS